MALPTPLELGQLILNGLATGSIVALGSVGLTLTYGILRLPNFAHGDFLSLGAYLTLAANLAGIPLVPALLLGIVATVGAFLASEQVLWQPLRQRRATSTTLMIISIGLALFLRNGLILIWGSQNQNYRLPVFPAIPLGGGLTLTQNRLIVMGLAVLAMVCLHSLLNYTWIGKAMRAVADSVDLARVSGINVDRIVMWTWVVAGGLTALAGGMYGLITAVRPNMGWFLILPMFATVILGGIGNPYGAVLGALLITTAQEVSTIWLPTEYKLGVALVVMMVILLVRPQGLFRSTLS